MRNTSYQARLIAAARGPSAMRHRMVYPWLGFEAFDALKAEAARRAVHVDKLAAACLTLIARDDLFGAVLDGEEPADFGPLA